MRRFLSNAKGNVSVLFGVTALGTALAAGAAVDLSHLDDANVAAQAALDSATLAAAAAGTASNYATIATATFNTDIATHDIAVTNVSFTRDSSGVVTGTMSGTVPTALLRLAGLTTLTVQKTAVATGPQSSNSCILLTNPSASQALLMNSGANITLNSCEIDGKSTASPAAIFNSGSTISGKVCLEGSSVIQNGGTVSNLNLGCTTPADPWAGKITAPSSSTCDFSNMNYSGTVTLNPGTYCGWTNFNSATNVTLNPGTYVIKSGGWNVNGGTWNGSGVTFYYADTSKIQFNSGVAATLTAPSSGTYAGIVMAEASGLSTSQFILDDTKGFNISGVIYLPSRQVVLNSGASATSRNLSAVFNTLTVNQANWTVSPYNSGGSGSTGVALIQ